LSLFADKDYQGALEKFAEAITTQPNLRCAVSMRARCLLEIARRDSSRSSWIAALEGFKKAQGLPQGTVPPLPGDAYYPALDYLDAGLAQAALGNQEKAISEYDAFLSERPNNHVGLYNRSNALWRLARMAEAENGYRQAIAAVRRFAEARINLAELLTSLGRSDEATALMLETIAMPSDQFVWPITEQGRPWLFFSTLAVTYLVKATALDDDSTLFEEAVSALNRALCTPAPWAAITGMTPDMRAEIALMYLRRGFAHAKLGDRAFARSDMLRALTFAPTYSVTGLAADRFMRALSRNVVPSVLRVDVAGLLVAAFGTLLLTLVSVQAVRGALGEGAFATVAVASLGAMLLGLSLPHLTSFKLGVAEASLTPAAVTTVNFNLPEIGAPS